ncbi:MAG TPA: DUF2203 domain-containing protein [Candidatus Polarisedimenticolia bacterium]|nr:DUF2203 domain-containing protein [Candidatus Polarisedimenticolia bacterium]
MPEEKLFTVGEANRTLPRLSRLLQSMRDRFRWLSSNRRAPSMMIKEFNVLNEGPVDRQYFAALVAIRRGMKEVESLGVQVKDIRTGLVDFPARLYGRNVLLCWRLGEEQVRFWHDLEAGFAGRQPIPDQGGEPDTGGERH